MSLPQTSILAKSDGVKENGATELPDSVHFDGTLSRDSCLPRMILHGIIIRILPRKLLPGNHLVARSGETLNSTRLSIRNPRLFL